QPRGLTDLTAFATDKDGEEITIPGPDGRPLQGADVLLKDFHDEVLIVRGDPDRKVPGLILDISDLRSQQKDIQKQIAVAQVKLQKQLQIRGEVQEELLFLEDFRINTGGQRETVY